MWTSAEIRDVHLLVILIVYITTLVPHVEPAKRTDTLSTPDVNHYGHKLRMSDRVLGGVDGEHNDKQVCVKVSFQLGAPCRPRHLREQRHPGARICMLGQCFRKGRYEM